MEDFLSQDRHHRMFDQRKINERIRREEQKIDALKARLHEQASGIRGYIERLKNSNKREQSLWAKEKQKLCGVIRFLLSLHMITWAREKKRRADRERELNEEKRMLMELGNKAQSRMSVSDNENIKLTLHSSTQTIVVQKSVEVQTGKELLDALKVLRLVVVLFCFALLCRFNVVVLLFRC